MEILKQLEEILTKAPDWVALIVLPALLVPIALLCALLAKRRIYLYFAAFLGVGGFVLVLLAEDIKYAFYYAGLFTLVAFIVSLLLLIPSPLPSQRAARGSKQDRIYEQFRAELTEKPFSEGDKFPPKECCFNEEPRPAEESGFRLEHVTTLLKKLRSCPKLSAGDRLETDALSERLDGYRGRPLTVEERRSLNDVLSTVLKLTAKYQL